MRMSASLATFCLSLALVERVLAHESGGCEYSMENVRPDHLRAHIEQDDDYCVPTR